MPIQVRCSNKECGKVLKVKDELVGKTVRCPGCQTPIKLTASGSSSALSPGGQAAIAKGPPPVGTAPQKKPPRDQEDRPATTKGSGDDDRLASGTWRQSPFFGRERYMVKAKLVFFGPTLFRITNPVDKNDEIGVGVEKVSFFKRLLRGMSIGPIRFRDWLSTTIEVKEDAKAPPLFYVKKLGLPFSIFTTTVEIYDGEHQKIGYFKTKFFSFFGGFWLYDPDNQQVAEVQAKLSIKQPRLLFLANDGRELGFVSAEMYEDTGKKIKLVIGSAGVIPSPVSSPTLGF